MSVEQLDTSDPAWIEDPRLADYRDVRDPELVKRSARFIAEGRLVVRALLLDSPLRACSVLMEEPAWAALAPDLADVAAAADVPVYVVPAGALEPLTGWRFHQGILAVGERPVAQPVTALLQSDTRLLVGLERVSNPDNVGAIFRSAAALGATGVLLSPACASPLYRKAARTSMGAALRLPFSQGPDWLEALAVLKAHGFAILALTPDAAAPSLEDVAATLAPDRPRILLLGAEGDGLTAATRAVADTEVAIPMAAGVDSLNVAAAAAVALYRLRV